MAEAKIRIVCTGPEEAEREINELLEHYAPIVWNIQPGPNGPLISCIMLHEREIRKQMLMAPAGMFGPKG